MTDFYSEIFPARDGNITVNVYHGTRDDGFHRLTAGDDSGMSLEAGGYFGTVRGGAGNDTLTAGMSYVTLDGGAGDDYIFVDNTRRSNENISHVVLTGGAGKDTFAFMPGDHTIKATITDFDPADDTLVLVSLTADGNLAVLSAIDDGGIALAENEWGLAEAAARQSLSPNINASEGFNYDSDTRVAELYLSNEGLDLTFEGVVNIDEFKLLDLVIADTDGNSIDSRKVQSTLPNGLSIYHSGDYNEDWLYVSSEYTGDVWLGGVDWNGVNGLNWSDTTLTDIRANNDTVSGRMLAGNDNNNYIRAGSGGASLWGGTGGDDILYGGDGADTFIAATSSVEGYTNIQRVGENDIIHLDLFSSADILQSNDSDTTPLVQLTGYTSYYGSNPHWYIDCISEANINHTHIYNPFMMIGAQRSPYGDLHIYINPEIGARSSTFELADGYKLRFDYLNWFWEGYENDVWTPLSLKKGDLEIVDIDGPNALKLNTNYYGDVWLEGTDYFSSITMIDASDITVVNRVYVGNALDNSIVASSKGTSLWGVGGDDTLVGGAGTDIFYAGKSEGRNTLLNVADDDIIFLWNIAVDDLASLDPNFVIDSDGISLSMNDDSFINVRRAGEATTTTFMLGDYSRWQYSYSDQSWSQTVQKTPDSITRFSDAITITSSFEGNLVTGGVDWKGDTVDGWHDNSIKKIDARQDTVNGRLLAGNDRTNEIYAGSGGVSLWGGKGGGELYGGAGADTFIAGTDSRTYILDCDDNDLVVLYDINRSDIVDISFYEGTSSNSITMTMNNGKSISIDYKHETTTKTTIQYADGERRTFDHINGNWWDLFSNPNTPDIFNLNSTVYVSSSYVGDIVLGNVDWNDNTVAGYSNSSVVNIDAGSDKTSGRLLAGDSKSNDIYAGSGGNSLWGGKSGSDYLYGGAGADTFIAGKGDGYAYIQDYGDEDIVVLYDLNISDISSASLAYGSEIRIQPTNGSSIYIEYETDTTKMTIQYANGDTHSVDDFQNNWRDLFVDTNTTLPTGLTKYGSNMLYVSSEYVGDVVLGGVDWNGATVDAWSDTSVSNIDAGNDTVSGRLLAGDSKANYIYAGIGGNSLWGGKGGSDYLYGGAGADTFLAGKGNGYYTDIRDCGDEDIVVLYNINLSDIKYASKDTWFRTGIDINLTDGTNIGIYYDMETTNTTTIQYANGERRTFDHAEGNWRDLFADTTTTLPSGLIKLGGGVLEVAPSYAGNIALEGVDWTGATLDGWSDTLVRDIHAENDTVSGRLLAGNSEGNSIYAGSGGASLWGGNGSKGFLAGDHLYGGAGADTFLVGNPKDYELEEFQRTYVHDCGDEDIVVLYNVNISDVEYASLNSYNEIHIQTTQITDIYIDYGTDTTLTTIQYANGERRTFNHSEGTWHDLFADNTVILPSGLTKLTKDELYVFPSYVGNLALDGVDWKGDTVDGWSDTLVRDIHAENDTVSGRLLAGNSNGNLIYAGSGGTSLWGGTGGGDNLYGGAGADTFIAGKDEGNTHIYRYADEDKVVLYNLNADDIIFASISGSYYPRLNLIMTNYDNIDIECNSDTSVMSIQFADGEAHTIDVAADDLSGIFADADSALPTGLNKIAKTMYVSSKFEGDICFSDTDWNGNAVDAWTDTSIYVIDASADTIGDRMIVGNEFSNSICAGSGGVTLWGGNGGDDTLVGGAGIDTFIVRQGEGNITIDDYNSDEMVYMPNINFSDFKYLAWRNDFQRILMLKTNDGTTIELRSWGGGVITPFVLADGSTLKHDDHDGTWQLNTGNGWHILNEVNGMPVGVIEKNKALYVFTEYEGDFDLEDINDSSIVSLEARFDLMSGRKIGGNYQDNYIDACYAVGSWMWGGNSGDDTLYGGNGIDTFQAGAGEGNTTVLNYSNDDLIFLHNVELDDIQSVSLSGTDCVQLTMTDGTGLQVNYVTGTNKTKLRLANGDQYNYDHVTGDLQKITVEGTEVEVGLMKLGHDVSLSSEYESNLWLGSINLNGETVGGWSNDSIDVIDAANDTVNGRMLAGNATVNHIYAGSGGASLWGGIGSGDDWSYIDYLYGGAGVDTFIAGMGEGDVCIRNYADDDIIVLHNIESNDVYSISVMSANRIRVTATDYTWIDIYHDTDTITTTTIQYVDGTVAQYNHAEGNWSTLQSSDADDEMWGNGNVDDTFLNGVEALRADQYDDDDLTSILNVDADNALDNINLTSNDAFNINRDGSTTLLQYVHNLKHRQS